MLALGLALAVRAGVSTDLAFRHNLAVQVCLDRAGFSPNAIDGAWGRKSQTALATYCAAHGLALPPTPDAAYHTLFGAPVEVCTTVTVTAADHAALTALPHGHYSELAAMKTLGYETLEEDFAERGHLTRTALRRLNPGLTWPNPPVGSVVRLPDFASATKRGAPRANVLRVSLGRREITAFAADGRLLLLFPCSIAADKAKLPPEGEILIETMVPRPNYTYRPPRGPQYILPPGPNNPVGSVWMGLSLTGYGIHGTPKPEQIGRAESHGCFRLANWNARRLYALCDPGVAVVIEK